MPSIINPPTAFQTAGQALSFFRSIWNLEYAYVVGGASVISVDVGFLHGFGCIHYVRIETLTGDVYEQDILILNVTEGSQTNAGLFIEQAGFDAEATAVSYSGGEEGTSTPAEVLAVWEEIFIPLKMDMVDAYTTASPDHNVTRLFGLIGAYLVQGQSIFWCVDTGGSYVSREKLLVGDWGADSTVFDIQLQPYQSPIGTSGAAIAFDTAGIITALNDLTMQRQEISFNHGNVIFSIDGRIISGI